MTTGPLALPQLESRSRQSLAGAPALGPRYRIEERLGEGGMGVVWRAWDRESEQEVALKTLRIRLGHSDDSAAVARFRREFGAVSRLKHPSCVRVYDFGRAGDELHPVWYFTMELVRGPSFRELIGASAGQIIPLTLQVLGALDYVHARGIVHRDIKPENILVSQDRPVHGSGDVGRIAGGAMRAKLADFGLARLEDDDARLTRASVMVGTISYIAPELADGHEADPRSDLFSLGVVLYELLCQRLPFAYGPGETELRYLRRLRTEDPVPPRDLDPTISPTLESFVLRLLAKKPAERFQTAYEAFLQLTECLDAGDRSKEITAPVPIPEDLTGGNYLMPPAMVGQRTALEGLAGELSQAWGDGVAAPVVFLSGETGVGRTRVAYEFLRYARSMGAVVFRGESRSQHGRPLEPWTAALREAVRLCRRRRTELRDADPEDESSTAPDLLERYQDALARLLPELQKTSPALQPPSGESEKDEAAGSDAEVMGGPQLQRTHQLRSLARFLTALSREAPTVIVLEDFHFADQASHTLLRILSSELHHQRRGEGALWPRIMLLATYASDRVEPEHPVVALQDLLEERGHAHVLRVDPLAPEEVQQLVASMLGVEVHTDGLEHFVEQLNRRAEGNPQHVQALLENLVAEGRLRRRRGRWNLEQQSATQIQLPSSMREMDARRLRDLAPELRRLLELAAITGRDFDLATLLHAGGLEERTSLEALDEAQRLSLVEERDEGRYRFLHERVRELLYEGVDPQRRVVLHRRVAEALEQRAESQRNRDADHTVDAATLAHHYSEAGQPARAFRYRVRAGAQALAACAGDRALLHFERAVLLRETTPDLGPGPDLSQLRERLGDALALEGRYGDSARAYRESLRRADGLSDRVRRTRKLAEALARGGNLEEGARYLEAALEALGRRRIKSRWDARFTLLRGGIAVAIGLFFRRKPRPPRAPDALLRARLACQIYPRLSEALYYSRFEHALAYHVVGLNLAERIGESRELASACANQAFALASQGRFKLAERYALRAREMAERVGDNRLIARVWTLHGNCRGFAGDARGQVQFHERALELLDKGGDPYELDINLTSMVMAQAHLCDAAGLAETTERHERVAELTDSPRIDAGVHLHRGELALLEGDWGEALRRAELGERAVESSGDMVRLVRIRAVRARALAGRGDPVSAATCLEPLTRRQEELRLANPDDCTQALLAELWLLAALAARDDLERRGYLLRARRELSRARRAVHAVRYGWPRTLRVSAGLMALQRRGGARKLFRDALTVARTYGFPRDEADTQLLRGRLESRREPLEKAAAIYERLGNLSEARNARSYLPPRA